MKNSMQNGMKIGLTAIILSLAVLFLISFQFFTLTGNIVLEQESFQIGEQIQGNLKMTIEEGDSIKTDTVILLYILKDEEIVESQTLTFKKFIDMSDNPISPTEKPEGNFYETLGSHNVEVSKIITKTFEEPGEYKFAFSVLELGIRSEGSFTIQ